MVPTQSAAGAANNSPELAPGGVEHASKDRPSQAQTREVDT